MILKTIHTHERFLAIRSNNFILHIYILSIKLMSTTHYSNKTSFGHHWAFIGCPNLLGILWASKPVLGHPLGRCLGILWASKAVLGHPLGVDWAFFGHPNLFWGIHWGLIGHSLGIQTCFGASIGG
jgi:hypothetical protein